MKKTINKLAAYLHAAPIPHSFAAFSAANAVYYASNRDWTGIIFNTIPAILNEAIAAFKYRDYKRLDKAFVENGFDERLVRPYLASPCGRHIARAISNKHGYRERLNKTIEKYNIKPFTWSLEMIE